MRSKRVVIDASVARAAGKTDHPVSRACREFLEIARRHRVVMSDQIRGEWKENQSHLSKDWLFQMRRKGKVVELGALAPVVPLRTEIDEVGELPSRRREMLKDAHLLDAALATDRTVASRDNTVRALFGRCNAARKVIWADPVEPGVNEWFRAGAKAEQSRMLGHAAHGA